jgi:uncharacterized protein with PQ loop repeat
MLHSHASLLAMVAGMYGIVSALSPALQIARMRRAGSSASLSRGYVAIGAGGYVIWFLYGLSLGNAPLILCDAIGAAMQTGVLVWAVRIGRQGALAA